MRRIANGTQVAIMPARPAPSGTPGFGRNGNPSLGEEATIFDADTYNMVQEELCKAIEGMGIALDSSGANDAQLLAAIKKAQVGTLIGIQVFTASGTYTPTAGMRLCRVRVQGGGGSGGGATIPSAGNVSAGTPGASGSYAEGTILAATIGASKPVTIGAGAAGVTGASGAAGGTSSLGSLITCPGGPAGTANNNIPPPALSANGATSSAPTFGGGVTPIFSTTGQSDTPTIGLSGGSGAGGTGGRSVFGGGGLPPFINAPGTAAANRGAGGSGVYCGSGLPGAIAGGAGAPGIVIIEEYA